MKELPFYPYSSLYFDCGIVFIDNHILLKDKAGYLDARIKFDGILIKALTYQLYVDKLEIVLGY